jgi:asparagine synthase (glutamine-hydrolysing)
MSDQLHHRGPDAHGYFLDSCVALGHRRLSILDVSGGDQPLGNEDGSIQVVFNGEIYNYRELRQELINKGHRFTTNSDTEVLVHLYEDVGERLPEFLNGMFAFAIWDGRRRELFLARDRFGKKPLYYSFSVSGTRFCFASELKALTVLPGFDTSVDQRSLADFLCLSYVPDPATIYKSVFKLKPGHSLIVSDSGGRIRKYWEARFLPEAGRDFGQTVEEIRTLAADAVERRMISDVPLGAFLSGGVDSSAVVALMAKRAPDGVKTFSIGFTNEAFDELPFARLIVQRYHTDHREQIVTPSIHQVFKTLVEHFDEPFGDPSAIPTLYLAQLTRRHVTVALSGDGGDEVFAGYRRYYWALCEDRLRALFPGWFRRTVLKFGARHYPTFQFMPRVFRAKATLNFLSKELGDAYFTHMSTFRDEGIEGVLSPDMMRDLGDYSPRESFQERFRAVEHLSPVQQLQAIDFETYLPGDILVKVDRATMASSLEARCPWLDYRLAELACRLPPSFTLRRDVGKYILKEVMTPYLPPEVLHRNKMGFAVPLADWLRTSLKPLFETLVLRQNMEAYLCLPSIRKLWHEHQTMARNHDRKLWNMLMLAAWDAHLHQTPEAEMLDCPEMLV